MALWRIYSDRGIAIRSTFGRLATCIDSSADEHKIVVGTMTYVDHLSARLDSGSFLTRVFAKGPSFSYEYEVRAAFYVDPHVQVNDGKGGYYSDRIDPQQPMGFEVAVDLGELIEAVYVAPDRKLWFVNTIESLLAAYGLPNIPVEPSRLLLPPPWVRPGNWRTAAQNPE